MRTGSRSAFDPLRTLPEGLLRSKRQGIWRLTLAPIDAAEGRVAVAARRIVSDYQKSTAQGEVNATIRILKPSAMAGDMQSP